MKSPLCLEEIVEGMTYRYPRIAITKELRDNHVALYGEDWAGDIWHEVAQKGIVLSHLVISLIGGQAGKKAWLNVLAAKSYECTFYSPVKVGDIIRTDNHIVRITPHKDYQKNYGYVAVVQEIYNQNNCLVYERHVLYLVKRKDVVKEMGIIQITHDSGKQVRL
ncbi:hypothetical protein HY639_01840 [Candidatus Woesearchaeota archaeon]|nr:hypothetical protein [Candidatus Woesearchaeota archaeon]